MAGGGIPFHGSAEARVEVGDAFRDPAEFERAAGGKPRGDIWKYANIGMKDTWPVAYKVAKNYTIDAKELGRLGGLVDLENQSIEAVAAQWVKDNEATWRAWAE